MIMRESDIDMKLNKILLGGLIGAISTSAMAIPTEDELSQAAANPVADMVSVPVQSNWVRPVGPNDATRYVMNVQPVIPFRINDDWNLITRTIVPVIRQPEVVAGQGATWSTGDVIASTFFSPRAVTNLIWGVGPVFLLPTSSRDDLGAKKWGVGPSGVLLIQAGPWSVGGVANHIVSFAGNSHRDSINVTNLNPFVAYALGSGWSTTFQSEYIRNWQASSGRNTTSLGWGMAKVMLLGSQPVSIYLGYTHFITTPNGSPDNGIRLTMNFLFPK